MEIMLPSALRTIVRRSPRSPGAALRASALPPIANRCAAQRAKRRIVVHRRRSFFHNLRACCLKCARCVIRLASVPCAQSPLGSWEWGQSPSTVSARFSIIASLAGQARKRGATRERPPLTHGRRRVSPTSRDNPLARRNRPTRDIWPDANPPVESRPHADSAKDA